MNAEICNWGKECVGYTEKIVRILANQMCGTLNIHEFCIPSSSFHSLDWHIIYMGLSCILSSSFYSWDWPIKYMGLTTLIISVFPLPTSIAQIGQNSPILPHNHHIPSFQLLNHPPQPNPVNLEGGDSIFLQNVRTNHFYSI